MAKVFSSNPLSVLGDPQTPSPRERKTRRPKPEEQIPPENVAIFKFPDAEGTLTVPRHAPVEETKRLPEIDSLATNVGGTINVSPAKSACSETEVRVETNIGELIRQMKIEIKEEMAKEIRKCLEPSNPTLEFSKYTSKYACLRAIESWCIDRMQKIANLPSDTSHNSTVDRFLQGYNVNIHQEYLKSLRSSRSRDIGNSTAHPEPNDDDYANAMWRFLKTVLSEEECRKYKSLIDFGRGYINVSCKSGQ